MKVVKKDIIYTIYTYIVDCTFGQYRFYW